MFVGSGRGAEVVESPSTTRLLLASHRDPDYRAFRAEARSCGNRRLPPPAIRWLQQTPVLAVAVPW